MNMKTKNLNEEINRIKLLFGESLLYGNLNDKVLLTEQKFKLLKRLYDAAVGELRPGGYKKMKPRPGSDGSVIQIKKMDDGTVKWYRGDKDLGENPRMKDLVSDVGQRELDKYLGTIKNEQNLMDFLGGENYIESMKIILNDLKSQGFQVDGDFITKLKNSGTGLELKNYFSSDDFFKVDGKDAIRSIDDIKVAHPDFYAFIDDIPGLVDRLDDALIKSNRHYYDPETMNLAKSIIKLKSDWADDKLEGMEYGSFESDDVIEVIIPKKYADNINNTYGLKFERNPSDPNTYRILIDKAYYGNKEYEFLKQITDPQSIKGVGDDISPRPRKKEFMSKRSIQDLEGAAENMEKEIDKEELYKIQRFFSSADGVDTYNPTALRHFLSNTVIGKRLIKPFDGTKFTQYFKAIFDNPNFSLKTHSKEILSKKFRKQFPVKTWMKEGYGIGELIDPSKKLDSDQIRFLESVYIRKGGDPKNKTKVFLDAEDLKSDVYKDLGYVEGQIHPSLELKPDWRKELYHLLFNSDKSWIQKVSPKVAKGDFASWEKLITSYITTYAKYGIGYGGGIWLPYVYMKYIGTRSVGMFALTELNDFLAERNDIKVWEANRYKALCQQSHKERIKDTKMGDDIKKFLVGGDTGIGVETEKEDGSVTKDEGYVIGLLNSDLSGVVGDIKFAEDAFAGQEAPKITFDELWLPWSNDWLKTEKATEIEEAKIIYNVTNSKKRGNNWRMENGNLILSVTNNNMYMCSKFGEEGCHEIKINLTCQKFSDWYAANKTSIDKKELVEILYDRFWGWATGSGDYSNWLVNMVVEQSEQTYDEILNNVSDVLDVDGDGTITTNDPVEGAENLRNKTLENISGAEPNNLDKSQLARRAKNRKAN